MIYLLGQQELHLYKLCDCNFFFLSGYKIKRERSFDHGLGKGMIFVAFLHVCLITMEFLFFYFLFFPVIHGGRSWRKEGGGGWSLGDVPLYVQFVSFRILPFFLSG